MPQTAEQLRAGLQAALCIASSDFAVMRDWPVAACRRVPGYGHLDGYVCGQPDEVPAPAPPPPSGSAAIVAFGTTPDPLPKGGPGALFWSTTGMDADSCKVRSGSTTLAKQLPVTTDAWPLPAAQIKDGAKLTLVCMAAGVKHTSVITLVVA